MRFHPPDPRQKPPAPNPPSAVRTPCAARPRKYRTNQLSCPRGSSESLRCPTPAEKSDYPLRPPRRNKETLNPKPIGNPAPSCGTIPSARATARGRVLTAQGEKDRIRTPAVSAGDRQYISRPAN